jgi:hypothetical protein
MFFKRSYAVSQNYVSDGLSLQTLIPSVKILSSEGPIVAQSQLQIISQAKLLLSSRINFNFLGGVFIDFP